MKASTNYTSGLITTAIVLCSALVVFLTVGTIGNSIPSIDTKSISNFFVGEEENPTIVHFTKAHTEVTLTRTQGAEAQGADN